MTVVSDVEKAPVEASGGDQEGERERTTEEVPLSTQVASEPGVSCRTRDKSGGSPLTGQAVSGMEVARA